MLHTRISHVCVALLAILVVAQGKSPLERALTGPPLGLPAEWPLVGRVHSMYDTLSHTLRLAPSPHPPFAASASAPISADTVETRALAAIEFNDPGSPQAVLAQAKETRATVDPTLTADLDLAREMRETAENAAKLHESFLDEAAEEDQTDAALEAALANGDSLIEIGKPKKGRGMKKLKALGGKLKRGLRKMGKGAKRALKAAGKTAGGLAKKAANKLAKVLKSMGKAAPGKPGAPKKKRFRPPRVRSKARHGPFGNLNRKITLDDHLALAKQNVNALRLGGPVRKFARDVIAQVTSANTDKKKLMEDIQKGIVTAAVPPRKPRLGTLATAARLKKSRRVAGARSNKDVVDCVACRFAWLGVEQDLANANAPHQLYDAFVNKCAVMQESNIFFHSCLRMFGRVDRMIADYISGHTVNQMCMKAKMCR